MKNKLLSTRAADQRSRLHAYLREHKRISTLTAWAELDILAPAPRILELRREGVNIVTYWTVEDTPKGRHRIADYVLLSGGENE